MFHLKHFVCRNSVGDRCDFSIYVSRETLKLKVPESSGGMKNEKITGNAGTIEAGRDPAPSPTSSRAATSASSLNY
jgi:hypothetical protein